jgi:hypothetical protein
VCNERAKNNPYESLAIETILPMIKSQSDKDAGELFRMQFWKLPTYSELWPEELSIALSEDEGTFLKEQIIASFPDSLLLSS